FNCTIQELKPALYARSGCALGYFNCTIQELKQNKTRREKERAIFQLHHTGIKTNIELKRIGEIERFQLHHTGIKTTWFLFLKTATTKFQLHHTGIK
ncbi:hypothetical protein HMPREF1554_02172, partial [Porphyromonas gingivalis F0569]